MKTHPAVDLPKSDAPAKSLTRVLGQSEHVKNLVEECAEELASVNTVLKHELADHDTPDVEHALEKSEAVENKVQDASAKLAVVNEGLIGEVEERNVLEDQLAAVTEQEQAARHAAFHDPLTGLANRALFNDRLQHGLAQAVRHGWGLAVMFMDLNGFKMINDTHGHDAGDRVLQTVAGRLKENTRGDDTVSRLGGDEFVYLLMETRSEQDITAIAEKIIAAMRVPFDVNVGDCIVGLSISASIGIATYPKDGITADVLLKSADTAMYEAKRSKSGYFFA